MLRSDDTMKEVVLSKQESKSLEDISLKNPRAERVLAELIQLHRAWNPESGDVYGSISFYSNFDKEEPYVSTFEKAKYYYKKSDPIMRLREYGIKGRDIWILHKKVSREDIIKTYLLLARGGAKEALERAKRPE